MKKIEHILVGQTDKATTFFEELAAKVNELIDAHNELLETHTVKEPLEHTLGSHFECKACMQAHILSHTVKEPDEFAKKCPYRIPDCPIDYPTPPSNSEKEEWNHNIGARELKRDYPEETAGYSVEQIAEMYSKWSEDNYCAGWITPCKEYVEMCFRKVNEEAKE